MTPVRLSTSRGMRTMTMASKLAAKGKGGPVDPVEVEYQKFLRAQVATPDAGGGE